MRLPIFLLFTMTFIYGIWGQQNGVTIVEKKLAKRHLLYAKNEADAARSVFLKVNATGYRRRADRPMIKTIPPKSEVLMLTLIPLRDTISSYTYMFVSNTEQQDLGIIREKTPIESLGVNEFIESRNLVFTYEGCKKCQYLVELLKKERKTFREVKIKEKDWAYKYTLRYLENRGEKLDTIALPMALLKGKVVQPIANLNLFVNQLSK